jgi:hypothetical protein
MCNKWVWMVNVMSSCLPCGCLAVTQRTSFGHPYKVENWLNESDIVVGIVRRLRRWHWPWGNSQSTLFFRLNYNRPNSNLHLLISFETSFSLRFHFTVWCCGARPRFISTQCAVVSWQPLDAPSSCQVSVWIVPFWLPFHSLLYWTLSTWVVHQPNILAIPPSSSAQVPCAIVSQQPLTHHLVVKFSLDSAFLASILQPFILDTLHPGSASVKHPCHTCKFLCTSSLCHHFLTTLDAPSGSQVQFG